MRVLFICPTTSQPRFHRRIKLFQQAGYETAVAAFSRGYYQINSLPPTKRELNLGTISDGQYIKRIPKLLKASLTLRKFLKSYPVDRLYAFGVDNALLALSVSPSSYTYCEIGDLRSTSRKRLRSLFSTVSTNLLDRIDHIVVTSTGFVSELYPNPSLSPRPPVSIIENRLAPELASTLIRPQIKQTSVRPIRLGIVGLLRYKSVEWTCQFVAKYSNDFRLVIYGDGPLKGSVEQYAKLCESIDYRGPFKYPDQLDEIYGEIDASMVVYDATDINVRLAIPNKLFESLYYGIPIIAASDTTLMDYALQEGIGIEASSTNQFAFEKALLGLDLPRLFEMRANALLKDTNSLFSDYSAIARSLNL